ncbi:unnamed protein product [Leptosia nina]|uniref:Uncharacterized protein n=1 Tax=Leptosia nina TaxID=320188 RepID=A0AAV1JMZ8_9NEOP
MDRIIFSVNGEVCSAGSEVDSDETLNDFIRNRLNLRGTKYMCKEGGCGICIVSITAPDSNGQKRAFSVNSCLTTVLSCQDWEITTIEGLGSRQAYHPLQRTLAEHNGSQCGFCTPGWIMNMHSLLEANDYEVTQYEVENSFGSNNCRCTGYRPILDAFKSFAKDAPKTKMVDIEELNVCKNKGKCEKPWCIVEKRDTKVKKIKLKDDKIWYRVHKVNEIFDVWREEGLASYMLVNGNTGRGAVYIFEFPRVLIDISAVEELGNYYIDQNLVIGAGTNLTEVMEIFKTISQKYEDFSYLQKLYEHLDLVAHIPVRNVGSLAGNLMIKKRDMTFASDVFLLLEAIGAVITIVSSEETKNVTLQDFLSVNMKGKIITQVKIPPLGHSYKFQSFKVMPRSQNAVAQVNGAFLYELHPNDDQRVLSARIVYGGLSGPFTHAYRTENFLKGKKLFDNEVLQEAIHILRDEILVEEIQGMLKLEFRKKAAIGLFYKSLLNIIPHRLLNPRYLSGAIDLKKSRPLSKGTEVYDTNPVLWPLNEPMPKVEALIQCAGEATFVNDVQTMRKEVYCAFVTAKIFSGSIEHIDPTNALKIPGVISFYIAKDIPGKNTFISATVTGFEPEKILSDGKIYYFDQPIGILVAETEILAKRASTLVEITYKKDIRKPLLEICDVKLTDPSRIELYRHFPPLQKPGADVDCVIKQTENIYWQYHYSLETQSSVTRPSDDGIEVLASSQYPDMTHLSVSESLNIEQSRINVTIPRCGGGFGSKISRASLITAACGIVTYLLNRPCRFVMDIQANMRIIGKRLPCQLDYEVGVSTAGEIQYLIYDLYSDIGYFQSDLIVPISLPGIRSCYNYLTWDFSVYSVKTDTHANTYTRSPGSLEAISMTEHVMERISYELDLDPLEVRIKNINQEFSDVRDVVQTLLKNSDYEKRKKSVEEFNSMNRWKKRGLRAAIMSWPSPIQVDFNILISIYHGDGSVVVKHGGVEIGQGINTKVIQTVAYIFKIPLSKIQIKAIDVASNPNDYNTVGSRTTQAICLGAIKCCQIILDRLAAVKTPQDDPTWEEVIQAAFVQGVNLQASYHVTAADQEPHRSAGAAVAEVMLDILTGELQVLRVDIVEDVGTSINPEIDIGQIEGAFIMGLGYWTSEHIIHDEKTGEILTDRTWTYHIPQAKDIPVDFRIELRRNHNTNGILGARAVAEPGTCLAVAVALALKKAISDSREETGFPKNQWFAVDGPYTVEANVLHAEVNLEEFIFN